MEDLPDWFSGATSTTSLAVPEQFPTHPLDATHSLNVSNKTLALRNHSQGAGWRKEAITTISYNNALNLNTVATSSIHHHVSVSKVLIWLAYEDTLFAPLCCAFHLDPFANCQLHPERVTFQLKCSARCYQTKPLCIVVVEYDAYRQYRWNYVEGYFKTVKQPKQASLPEQLPSISFVSNQIQDVATKLEILTNEVKTLQQLLCVLIHTEQQQQQQQQQQYNQYARK